MPVQQKRQRGKNDHRGQRYAAHDESRITPYHQIEDQQHRPAQHDCNASERDPHNDVCRLHNCHFRPLAEEGAMQVHRSQAKRGGDNRSNNKNEINPNLESRQIAEPLQKRDREQEPGEDLSAGLG